MATPFDTVGIHVSAPVLSWLFIAQGETSTGIPVHRLPLNVNPLDTARRPAASEQLALKTRKLS